MFIGHFAMAFGAKKIAPEPSLGTLVAAAQLPDLLFPLLVLLGVEHLRVDPGNTVVVPMDFYDYPFSHSLAGVLLWSVLFGGGYFLFRRSRRGALIVGAAVFSHWILDFVTHRPDLPLAPGGTITLGLGLWNSFWGTAILESALFATGVALYIRTTRPIDATGRWALWGLVLFLGILYGMNMLGPPPPDISAFAYVGLIAWLFIVWAAWADRHRTYRLAQTPETPAYSPELPRT